MKNLPSPGFLVERLDKFVVLVGTTRILHRWLPFQGVVTFRFPLKARGICIVIGSLCFNQRWCQTFRAGGVASNDCTGTDRTAKAEISLLDDEGEMSVDSVS